MDPLKAAEFAATFMPPKWGAVQFIGLGPHVPAMMRKVCESYGVEAVLYMIFEPDPAAWRRLFEDDQTDWLAKSNWRLIDRADDEQQVFRALNAAGFTPAFGCKVVTTHQNNERFGPLIDTFCETSASAWRNWRLEMISALALPDKTQRNALANLRAYVDSPGITDLELRYHGLPGLTIAAGPSLVRNIQHLKRANVRESFVISCVQTALKPLLAEGIRPHFVCALDYAEISRRFYEGLTAEDCAGIELVCLSAAHPVIPLSWKGEKRFPSDGFIDGILGDDRVSRGRLPPASSVAHMSYNLLRYVGCDPVVLVGQDLAYTDGVYYGKGAAIHEAWAGEVNQFNSIESMEHERCRRAGDSLVWRLDDDGRPVRTDLQLDGYRARFEQQFAEDVAHGLRVIDATEGGQAKKHCTRMKLGKVIDQWCGAPVEVS